LGPAFEEHLALAPANLEPVREPQAELDHAMIEERHARLDAEGHQDAVRLDEQVVRQPGAEVGVLTARDAAPDARRRLPRRDEGLASGVRRRLQLGAERPLRPAPAPLAARAEAARAGGDEVLEPSLQRRAPIAAVAGEDLVAALAG